MQPLLEHMFLFSWLRETSGSGDQNASISKINDSETLVLRVSFLQQDWELPLNKMTSIPMNSLWDPPPFSLRLTVYGILLAINLKHIQFSSVHGNLNKRYAHTKDIQTKLHLNLLTFFTLFTYIRFSSLNRIIRLCVELCCKHPKSLDPLRGFLILPSERSLRYVNFLSIKSQFKVMSGFLFDKMQLNTLKLWYQTKNKPPIRFIYSS